MGRKQRFEKLQAPKELEILNRVQSNVEKVINPIVDTKIVYGNLLKDVELDSSVTNIISHKLGRLPEGWIPVTKSEYAQIKEVSRSDIQLKLQTSANVVVDLWVF